MSPNSPSKTSYKQIIGDACGLSSLAHGQKADNQQPVRMNGTVEGKATLLKICHTDAPKLLAAVSKFCGVS